jgi:hypothetical protein
MNGSQLGRRNRQPMGLLVLVAASMSVERSRAAMPATRPSAQWMSDTRGAQRTAQISQTQLPTATVLPARQRDSVRGPFPSDRRACSLWSTTGPIPSDSGGAEPFALLACAVASTADDLCLGDPRPRRHGGAGVPRRHSGNGHGRRSDTNIRPESRARGVPSASPVRRGDRVPGASRRHKISASQWASRGSRHRRTRPLVRGQRSRPLCVPRRMLNVHSV